MTSRIPEHLKPSIFESLCRDKLDSGLHPAFTDIARVFTRNSNRAWVRGIDKYSNELFLVFYGILQFKYLFQYDGTFGENFYGLKRVFYDSNKKKYVRLGNKQRIIALLSLLIFPYLRNKMDQKYKNLLEMTEFEREQRYIIPNNNNNDNNSDNSDNSANNDDLARKIEMQRKIDNLYLKYYKYFDAIIELISFLFKISFLFLNNNNNNNNSKTSNNGHRNSDKKGKREGWSIAGYDSLLSWILGQKTIRIDIEDLKLWKEEKDVFKSMLFDRILGYNSKNVQGLENISRIANIGNNVASGIGGQDNVSRMDKLRYLGLRLVYILGNVTKLMTLSVLFGFRWIEWFFMEEDRLVKKRELNVPKPPKIITHSKISNEQLLNENKLCFLCNKTRTNSACIPTGYVFCYNCIFPFVQENHCCPITRMPCTAIQIRKIFETS